MHNFDGGTWRRNMAKSTFVSIEVENGKVVNIEGNIKPDPGFWGGINSAPFLLGGQKVNDALNACAEEGYEHFATETVGKKTIYRLKLLNH
jgi:hypothetical protein